MSAIDDNGYRQVLSGSPLAPKYSTAVNRESAHEIIQRKLEASATARDQAAEEREAAAAPRRGGRTAQPKSMIEEVLGSSVARQAGRAVAREVVRGIFGMLRR